MMTVSSPATFIPVSHGIGPRGPMDPEMSPEFTQSSRNTLITTTVVGGTFVVALLIYVFYRRRRGATYAQILHVPARDPRTPQLTPTPMRQKFLKHPIYHDLEYSVRSSRHISTTSFPPRAKLNTSAPVGRPRHQRIESGWKDVDAPMTPLKDIEPPSRHTFFFDASPSIKPQVPEKAHVSVRPLSQISRGSSIKKQASVVETSASTGQISATCESPLDTPPVLDINNDRWSWTNSQAPDTPRLLPKSRRASLMSGKHSAPRFRSVVSWARGQGERIRVDEEAPPLLPTKPQPPHPTIQPVPANKKAFKDSPPPDLSRKLTKQKPKGSLKGHNKGGSSLGNLAGLFKSSSNAKSMSNLPSSKEKLESGQSKTDIELKERQRSQ